MTRIVRLGVSVATSGDVRRKSLTPLRSCFKTFSEKTRAPAAWSTRCAASLPPLGTPVELEIIFEVAG